MNNALARSLFISIMLPISMPGELDRQINKTRQTLKRLTAEKQRVLDELAAATGDMRKAWSGELAKLNQDLADTKAHLITLQQQAVKRN